MVKKSTKTDPRSELNDILKKEHIEMSDKLDLPLETIKQLIFILRIMALNHILKQQHFNQLVLKSDAVLIMISKAMKSYKNEVTEEMLHGLLAHNQAKPGDLEHKGHAKENSMKLSQNQQHISKMHRKILGGK